MNPPSIQRVRGGGRAAAALGVVLAALATAGWLGRPNAEIRVETRVLPAPVDERPSACLARGWQVVVSPGRAGEALALVRVRRWGGREMSRVDADVRLVREPRTEVRVVGTAAEENPVSAPRLTRAVRAREMLATAYDPGPADNGFENAGTTRLGWRARRGIVAVDPAVIPLRSLLWVPGYGLAWAGDTGGRIRGDHVDLCFNRTEDVAAWGRRRVRIYVLEGVRPAESRE
jgi:3D (Asp-Asp-Asp) domain-containing protein